MVLVALVHGLDGMEVFVPARIRLECVDLVDDVFRGQVHLSGINGATKTLRRLGEGEADAVGTWCLVADHPVTEVVKGCPEVVDRIADGQREGGFWNGWIGMDVNHALRGVLILADSEVERAVRKILPDLPVQVIDVLLGPLDF
jgi:hypothetical protein